MENDDPNPIERVPSSDLYKMYQDPTLVEKNPMRVRRDGGMIENPPANAPSVLSPEKLQRAMQYMMQGGKEFTNTTADSTTTNHGVSGEESLYDTYAHSEVVESNPMLEKKINSLSPLKLNALMGDGVKQQISLERANILPKDGKKKPLQYQNDSDINNKQSNDRFSAVEEKLYDTYTSPDVVESNPMLVKRRDSLTPLKLNALMGGESRPSSPIGAQANHKSNSSYNKRPINDVDDRLYDTYNEQSVIESNPMLQKRRDALSPLKLQALNGESRSTSPMRQRGDIDGRQQKSINDKEKSVSSSSGSTDDELFQLHNIYKESSLLDENPMLEKKRPTIDTSISKKAVTESNPLSPTSLLSPERIHKAFNNMFWGRDINENKINDDKPNATADATTANKNVKNADDFMYDEVYESRNLVETNPMKRKSVGPADNNAYPSSTATSPTISMASLNSEMNLGRNHSEFNINSIQSRPVPRGRKHVAALYHTDSDHEDTDDEDEILNESAVGAELYNVYNAPQMNESNPMFFERRAGGPQRSATNYFPRTNSSRKNRGTVPTVPLDITTIRNVTSNNGFLVLQPRLLPENIATTEMQNPTLLLTDKLTHVVLKSFVHAAADGKLYDWTRGPTAEGWFMKLSSRGTGITRQMKRYFVLRNRTLQCFRVEPQRGMNYSLGGVVDKNADSDLSASLLLTADASVHVECSSMSKSKSDKKSEKKVDEKNGDINNNSTSLLTITTPGKTFNIRLRGGKHAQTEATFISQLRKTIEMAKSALPQPNKSTRADCIWTHFNRGAILSAVDVITSLEQQRLPQNANKSVNFALLRVPVDDEALNMPFLKSKPNSTSISTSNQMTASQFAAAGPSAMRDRDKVYLSLPAAGNGNNDQCATQEVDEDETPGGGVFNYCLSVSNGDGSSEPVQLDVLGLKYSDSAVFTTNIVCMQALGDCLILGGTEGFLGIGVVGKSLCSFKNNDRVLYCVSARENAAMMASNPSERSGKINKKNRHNGSGYGFKPSTTTLTYPHKMNSTVICTATNPAMHTYAVADSHGIISFWHLETATTADPTSACEHWLTSLDRSKKLANLARCYKIRNFLLSSFDVCTNLFDGDLEKDSLRHKERIMSMKFSPDGRYLVVSTKLRLLLLGLEKDNNSFSVCSWMELDRVEGLTAIFSVDFILVNKNNDEGEEIDKVVIWKVEDRSASITDSDGVEKPYNSDIDLESTPIIDGRAVEKKNRRCGISRKELTANMWNETIQSIKYI